MADPSTNPVTSFRAGNPKLRMVFVLSSRPSSDETDKILFGSGHYLLSGKVAWIKESQAQQGDLVLNRKFYLYELIEMIRYIFLSGDVSGSRK